MAGIITHIAIADKISCKLGDKIKSVPYFFSGNIAPDSIHSRENFTRPMKKHTHLRDGIADADFMETENQQLFHERLEAFIKEYCRKGEEDYDLYCGYVCHLIADEIFIKTIRRDFCKQMERLRIRQSDRDFFLKITSDLGNIDNRLSREFAFFNAPKDTLWKVKDYEVRDYLTADELTSSKGWVTWSWFDNVKDFSDPRYISYESVIEFIDCASDEISEKLHNYNLY